MDDLLVAKYCGEWGRNQAAYWAEEYHKHGVQISYTSTLEDIYNFNRSREQFEALLDIRRMHREGKADENHSKRI